MKNADVGYRYYDYFNPPKSVRIAFSDKIRAAFFQDVISFGTSQIIKELDIPYDTEENGSNMWIFNTSSNGEEFKVSWQFNGKIPFSLKIGYYENNDCLDQQVIYNYTTYEEALDFIQDYMTKILTYGVPQAPELSYDEADVSELKLMHQVMQSMNDEDAYFTWIIGGVPDGATEEDFIDIAANPEEFKDCKQIFDRLFTRYAPDGLFKPTPEEVDFANKVCERLGLPAIEILK